MTDPFTQLKEEFNQCLATLKRAAETAALATSDEIIKKSVKAAREAAWQICRLDEEMMQADPGEYVHLIRKARSEPTPPDGVENWTVRDFITKNLAWLELAGDTAAELFSAISKGMTLAEYLARPIRPADLSVKVEEIERLTKSDPHW
jgi:hypothetical protein